MYMIPARPSLENWDEGSPRITNSLIRQPTHAEFEDCCYEYISLLTKIKTKLEEKFKPIAEFRKKTNIGRTVGTVTGVIGTSLTVTGVALAPITFGTSLGLTIAGISTSAAATAATVSTALVDRKKTSKIISDIELILKELEDAGKKLAKMMDNFTLIVIELMKLGYTKEDAITRTLYSVVKGVVNLGRISQNVGNVVIVVNNLSISKTALESTSNFVKVSILGSNMADVGARAGISFSSAGSATVSAGGKVITSTSKTLFGLSVGLGVAFTILDIALLVNDWNKAHPTTKGIKGIIQNIDKEIYKWQTVIGIANRFMTNAKINELEKNVARLNSELEENVELMEAKFEEKAAHMEAEFVEKSVRMEEEFEEKVARIRVELDQNAAQKEEELAGKFARLQAEIEKKAEIMEAFISRYNNS